MALRIDSALAGTRFHARTAAGPVGAAPMRFAGRSDSGRSGGGGSGGACVVWGPRHAGMTAVFSQVCCRMGGVCCMGVEGACRGVTGEGARPPGVAPDGRLRIWSRLRLGWLDPHLGARLDRVNRITKHVF